MIENPPAQTPLPQTLPQTLPESLEGRSVVLVGLMGAGKTTIGRRLARRLGLPFADADAEIEQAAGCTIPELFARFGEAEFRAGERRVVRRLLSGAPVVLATGGGAFMDPATRATVRANAVSIWLRSPLEVLVRRVALRNNRPLLTGADPAEVLTRLSEARNPIYAEADLAVDTADDGPETTTGLVAEALASWRAPRRLRVALAAGDYDIAVGAGLLSRAGGLLAPVLAQKRAIVVTDENVAALHLPALAAQLEAIGVVAETVVVPPGETSKCLAQYGALAEAMLACGVERRSTVIALGGGVVGDLAGFAAATVMRGLPFVQVPTTLLAQVDSSVGGKTGIDMPQGKNLLGAFHQPRLVIADTATLATLPPRELRAGYGEVVKTALIGDADFFAWCEENGAALLAGDAEIQAEAVLRACEFKAQVVGEDERETASHGGRALLNLGHTFGHALEAELGFGTLLHGEAVALGLGLAYRLSARLGLCDEADAGRIIDHLAALGMVAELARLNRRLSAADLIRHMRHDKKMRAGRLTFVLAEGIGHAVTRDDVPMEAVLDLLRDEGCAA